MFRIPFISKIGRKIRPHNQSVCVLISTLLVNCLERQSIKQERRNTTKKKRKNEPRKTKNFTIKTNCRHKKLILDHFLSSSGKRCKMLRNSIYGDHRTHNIIIDRRFVYVDNRSSTARNLYLIEINFMLCQRFWSFNKWWCNIIFHPVPIPSSPL